MRLGWTVVPKKLRYADGSSVHADWNRMMTTCFNGASNIVQAGGLACLQVGAGICVGALTLLQTQPRHDAPCQHGLLCSTFNGLC